MCGIFAILNANDNTLTSFSNLSYSFDKGKPRGPEFSILNHYNNLHIGFHRLAINGLNTKSNQPFDINNIILVCNGEIYNFKELAEDNSITLTTDSDCEIILHLYQKYGIEFTLSILDGVFAFVLYDKNINKVIVGRDPYGVRPLYYFNENNIISFASELKVLYPLLLRKKNINHFPPGSFMILDNSNSKNYNLSYKKYTSFPCSNIKYLNRASLYYKIIDNLESAVKKRVSGTTERPIGCLLSGGLDSSIITSIVCNLIGPSNVKTFAIGLEGSPDLLSAQKVATYLGTNHTNVIVTEKEMLEAIDPTIYQIESNDITTIRASVPMFLLSKYIRDNTDIKVIFSGEGSDEASGSYLYFHKAPNPREFEEETLRLLKDVRMFDVLRADKTTAGNGLELRVPYFDKEFLNYYMGIDPKLIEQFRERYGDDFGIKKWWSLIKNGFRRF